MERREELLAIESAARAGLLDDSDEITEGIGVYLRIPDLTSLSREFPELLLLRLDAVQRVRDVLAGLDLDGELRQQSRERLIALGEFLGSGRNPQRPVIIERSAELARECRQSGLSDSSSPAAQDTQHVRRIIL